MPPLCELGAELLSMPALLEPGAGLLSMPAKLPCASKERSYSRSRCLPCVRRERSYSRCLPFLSHRIPDPFQFTQLW